ncbi:MAG TPA: hypothetical protein VM328_01725 [Fimbriimonadaceae bacterium]|nr:hypothetical protein [Fimbriimonadaceae bacterium]
MSRIENRVKPLLIPMILASERIVLGPAEQKKLARWAYLKTLVFALSTPEFGIVESEYHRFYQNPKPPHGSVILLSAILPGRGYPGSLCRVEPVLVHDADGSAAPNYRCSFLMGHVFLQVFGPYPGRRRPATRQPGRASDPAHSPRIWRTQQRPLTFPPPKQFDPRQIEQLLELLYNPPDEMQ